MRHKHHLLSGLLLSLLLLIILSSGGLLYLRPLPALSITRALPTPQTDTVNIDWPANGSTAAIGAVGYGTLASDSNSQFPTASIAKLITALTILEKMPLQPNESGPTLTISARDVDLYNSYVAQDGSVTKVSVGEQLSEYQALQSILLPSSDNIADSLALWAYGSIQNYQVNASQLIRQLGLNNTVIGNDASGLSPTTMSSAGDLVKIGLAALQNPVICQIVNQSTANLPVAGTVHNFNSLLGKYGINGIKTGNSNQAGGVFLFSALDNIDGHSVTVIGAIMHAPNLATATNSAIPLLVSAEKGFTLQTPIRAGQQIGQFTSKWGATAPIIALNDMSLPVWAGDYPKPHVTIKQINGTEPSGTLVGTISMTSGASQPTSPLILKGALAGPSVWWRLTHH